MPDYDITILTNDEYINNPKSYAAMEDQVLCDALLNKGFRVARKSWTNPSFDWSSTARAIFRTTWDYFHRPKEWQLFLDHISEKTELINPMEMVRWNMDKHYLGDLSERGIQVPETRYLEIGESRSLAQLQKETSWKDMILKPCFAGTARHTYRLNPENLESHEALYAKLIKEEAFMLQPFLKNVVTQGEVSMVIIGGQYSHAVIKKAKAGDFRVQGDFGGSVALYESTTEEIDFALNTVLQCDTLPVYARVDIVKDNEQQLSLIELEVIEPELWFRLKPEAADMLAEMI